MPKINLRQNLQKEISKWLPQAKEEFKKIRKTRDPDFLKNIGAYLKDAEYFLEKKDLIRSFEAVIWAWAWLEIGKRRKIIA